MGPSGETQLADLNERLRDSVVAPGIAGSWTWDIPGRELFVDERFAALYGLDDAAASGPIEPATFYAAIHPDDRMRLRVAVAGMLQGAEVFSKEYRVLASDKSIRWVQARGRSHFDVHGTPIRFAGVLVDITERKRAEEQLRIAQTAGGIGTFEHVEGFGTVTVSDQFCRLLGLHACGAIPAQTVNHLVLRGSGAIIEGAGDAEVGESPYAEFPVARADNGERRWIARRGEYVRDADTAGLRHVGVIYDITAAKTAEERLRELNETLEMRVDQEIRERRQAEEALRQSQKMEAMGQLTGGIAHDFNNLLTIIIGNVDAVTRRLPQDSDPRITRALEHAHRGAERAAALTQRLLAFSRRQPLAPRPTNVGRLLSGVSELLGRTLGERILVETLVAPDLWRVDIDAHQLENALVNLAVNARDAMPEGGRLHIAATNLRLEDDAGTMAPGSYVEIVVADTGIGMPAEVMGRAFDPFFTTKEVGKGTGLGLSMVHGFVNQSGGHVAIESETGVGTAVKLYLPRLDAEEEQTADPARAGPRLGSPAETILIVEDDDDVRAYTTETLRELGYTVLEASEGNAALELLTQRTSSIQMLVTDVVMPVMSGRELADRARQQLPDLPVLFISGYPRDAIAQDGRIGPDVDLLSKPFTFRALSEKVRELLDAAPPGRTERNPLRGFSERLANIGRGSP